MVVHLGNRRKKSLQGDIFVMFGGPKVLAKTAAEGAIPVGLWIQRVRAKGQDVDTLQA